MGRIRRPSTSSSGTPARPGCPPGCTPSTCAGCTSRTGSPPAATIGRKKVSLGASPPSSTCSAREDHITPWRGCYKTTQLAGGPVRFVLTSSGHIAGIVNPPGPKRKHWTNDALPADPDAWYAGAAEAEDPGGRTGRAGRRAGAGRSVSRPRSGEAHAARGRARLVRANLILREAGIRRSGSRVAQHLKASASRPQISLRHSTQTCVLSNAALHGKEPHDRISSCPRPRRSRFWPRSSRARSSRSPASSCGRPRSPRS